MILQGLKCLAERPRGVAYLPGLISTWRISATFSRNLAQVRSDTGIRSEAWFTPSGAICQIDKPPLLQPDVAPPDERTLKLGSSMFAAGHPTPA